MCPRYTWMAFLLLNVAMQAAAAADEVPPVETAEQLARLKESLRSSIHQKQQRLAELKRVRAKTSRSSRLGSSQSRNYATEAMAEMTCGFSCSTGSTGPLDPVLRPNGFLYKALYGASKTPLLFQGGGPKIKTAGFYNPTEEVCTCLTCQRLMCKQKAYATSVIQKIVVSSWIRNMAKDCKEAQKRGKGKARTKSKCACKGGCDGTSWVPSNANLKKWQDWRNAQRKKKKKKSKKSTCTVWKPGFTLCMKKDCRKFMNSSLKRAQTKFKDKADEFNLSHVSTPKMCRKRCIEHPALSGTRCGMVARDGLGARRKGFTVVSSCDDISTIKLKGPKGVFEYRVEFSGIKSVACSPKKAGKAQSKKKTSRCLQSKAKNGGKAVKLKEGNKGETEDSRSRRSADRAAKAKVATDKASRASRALMMTDEANNSKKKKASGQKIRRLTCQLLKEKVAATGTTAFEFIGRSQGWCTELPATAPRQLRVLKLRSKLKKPHPGTDKYDLLRNFYKKPQGDFYPPYTRKDYLPTIFNSFADPKKKSKYQCMNKWGNCHLMVAYASRGLRQAAQCYDPMFRDEWCGWYTQTSTWACKKLPLEEVLDMCIRALGGFSYLGSFALSCLLGPPVHKAKPYGALDPMKWMPEDLTLCRASDTPGENPEECVNMLKGLAKDQQKALGDASPCELSPEECYKRLCYKRCILGPSKGLFVGSDVEWNQEKNKTAIVKSAEITFTASLYPKVHIGKAQQDTTVWASVGFSGIKVQMCNGDACSVSKKCRVTKICPYAKITTVTQKVQMSHITAEDYTEEVAKVHNLAYAKVLQLTVLDASGKLAFKRGCSVASRTKKKKGRKAKGKEGETGTVVTFTTKVTHEGAAVTPTTASVASTMTAARLVAEIKPILTTAMAALKKKMDASALTMAAATAKHAFATSFESRACWLPGFKPTDLNAAGLPADSELLKPRLDACGKITGYPNLESIGSPQCASL